MDDETTQLLESELLGPEDRSALLDDSRHLEALTVLSSEALRRGDAFRAFMFADRRCRSGPPDTHDLLLRGEALRRLAHDEGFDRDLRRAFELDPTDPLVNAAILQADRPEASAAARWVASDPRAGLDLRRAAVARLFADGYGVVGQGVVEGGRLRGWAAWSGRGLLTLVVEAAQGTTETVLQGDEQGAAQGPWFAAIDVALDDPLSDVRLRQEPLAEVLLTIRRNPGGIPVRPPASAVTAARQTTSRDSWVTVIVPVYDDWAITQACLVALAAQVAPGRPIVVVVVDDAAPAEGMSALVAELCDRYGFKLVVHARNLGFVGAVNAALDLTPEGDVLLLNSDVILPAGAIGRLAVAAQQRPGIGIVNPLTNNGQFCSYPAMFVTEPLESQERIAAIDRIAARVNAGVVVPVPSGNGFCMYVTRACLDAVGAISEVYLRGYYEDVELSLRARHRGFESICAANVYVGHKGSASFKDEKRGLVKRNQRVLRTRFSIHRSDTRAFARADPLRPSRIAIEAEASPLGPVDVVVAGSAAYAGLLDRRAMMLRGAGQTVMVLSWSVQDDATIATLRPADAARPRCETYPLSSRGPQLGLVVAVARLAPARLEIAGPRGPFAPTLDALAGGGLAFGYLVGESLDRWAVAPGRCDASQGVQPCASCLEAFDPTWEPQGVGASLAQVVTASEVPAAVVVSTDVMAGKVAGDLVGDLFDTRRFEQLEPPPGRQARVVRRPERRLLGLLYPQADLVTERLIGTLAADALSSGSAWSLLVVGQALDERKLLSVGNLFVSGPVDEDDCPDLLDHYGVSALLAPQRWAGYGELLRWAEPLALPKAYFDWSLGAVPALAPDLSLDPRLCDRKAARLLRGWLGALAPAVAA